MPSKTAAPAELHTLNLYPTTDLGHHFAYNFANLPHTPFSYLLEFAKRNGFSLRHDIESSALVDGWFVERVEGVVGDEVTTQLFAATITA